MKELLKALLEAEKNFTKIEMNKSMRIASTQIKYADLLSLFNATKKALRDQGLKVIGTMSVSEDGVNILTMALYHTSGEHISSSVRLPRDITQSKELGSIMTYMRRYLYSTLLGIVGDEDVDGDDLDNVENSTNSKNDSPISSVQIARLNNLLGSNDGLREKIEARLKTLGYEDYSQIPQSKFKEVIAFVESKLKEGK